MNKNKCRIHLTNTTDIKGGKNEKNPFHQSIGEDLCINNYTAGFDNLYYMGQFSIDGKYG